MPDVDYLTASDLLALTDWFSEHLGYARPTLRAGGQALLESAVHHAQTAGFYCGADVVLHAAALADGIAVNPPFLDGNKRSAWVACVAFLWLNGHRLPDEALGALADHLIAQHEHTDRSQADALLADWLGARLMRRP